MNLRIFKAGVLDTVQDLGRYGWQHLGVSPGGVMDRLSASFANILVGNEPVQPLIEMHFPASAFFFEQPALIALAGADFKATVNGEEIPMLHPVLLSRFSILQFHGLVSGARAYLAIRGGLQVPAWLGSCSTNLKTVAGGYHGRALQKEDEIPIVAEQELLPVLGKKEFVILPWSIDTDWGDPAPGRMLAIQGQEWDTLTEESAADFPERIFSLSNQCDRMGYCFEGESLSVHAPTELLSAAVTAGTVQLLPDGQLIVLMADHQTTGGYPRIAHVITAHQPKLAQLKPGESIRFGLTDLETAGELAIKQRKHLQQLQNACTFRLEELLDVHH